MPSLDLCVVSPGTATDGVTLYFFSHRLLKTNDFFSYRHHSHPLRLPSLSSSPVFFANSATKINFGCRPIGWCHPGRSVPPMTPLSTVLKAKLHDAQT